MSELASSPLQVLTYPQHRSRGGVPLMMEFPINPALSPFLVSSTTATMWVGKHRGGKIRAATREAPDLLAFFQEVIDAVIDQGREREWGNVRPLSKEGLEGAISHLASYGLEDVEILANPDTPWGDIEESWAIEDGSMAMALLGRPVQPAPWLRPDTLVVVPKDREYVGFVLLFEKRIASVVHNAARGIGIATARGA